jgi:heme exporter protein B
MSQLSIYGAFKASFRRDLLLAYRRLGDFVNPLVFFLIVCTLFPLGIGPDPKTLALLAPALIWVVALLSCLLSSDTLFRTDFDDGSLEQMALSSVSLYTQMMAKSCTHWLLTGLPLAIISPVLGVMLHLPENDGVLFISLLIGTVTLSAIGAVGAALTVSLRKGGLLISLIILPLYIPVLIFGVSAVYSAVNGADYSSQLAILGAFLALSITLAPLAIAGAVRISVDN